MPKYALLLAGQPRTFEFCYLSLKHHILDVYNPDVFICADSEGEKLAQLYKPVGMAIVNHQDAYQEAIDLRNSLGLSPNIPEAALSVAYKVMLCNGMKMAQEIVNKAAYDVIILTRFDVKFATVQPIGEIKLDTLYVPFIDAYPIKSDERPGHHWGGYSAHLSWMSSHVADKLANMYFSEVDWLKLATEAKADWGQNPEHVLEFYCTRNNINVEFINVDMMLIRGTSKSPLAFNNTSLKSYPKFRRDRYG